MPKPRVLIPISLQFSVRYLLRTGLLKQLAHFCDPVVMLAWRDDALEEELSQFCEVHAMPRAQKGAQYEHARGILNAWHQRRLASPSTEIRERRANLDRAFSDRWKRRLRMQGRRMATQWPGSLAKFQEAEASLFWGDTNARAMRSQLDELRLDAAFCLTPFLADEEMVVRAAVLGGMPSCAAILSFDNLTTRDWIPIRFDSYLLWNRHNVEQLRRGYPEAASSRVTLVGSPQFDFYSKPEYIQDEATWRNSLHLPADRPIVLFGGGYYSCAPHEPQFLAQLDEAIERKQIRQQPLILFRRHPVDPMERWEPVLKNAKHIVHDDPWQFGSKVLGHTNVRNEDIVKLASTLRHTAVHINVASTMTIDGAIFDRPQIGPAYDDSPGRKYHRASLECYQQEHFLPILNSGGLQMARNRETLIHSVSSALARPYDHQAGRRRIVEEICSFTDGCSTERVVEAMRTFIGSAPLAQQKAAIGAGAVSQ